MFILLPGKLCCAIFKLYFHHMGTVNPKIEKLRDIVKHSVFITKEQQKIVSSRGGESNWLFDFRSVFLEPEPLNLIADIFWQKFGDQYPFQVGGQETAAIPLVAAIVMKSLEKEKPVNGFFIRKSRKHDGLQKVIEGKLNNEKIILIDDLINSGQTLYRQIEVLESLGRKVDAAVALLSFRNLDGYDLIHERGVRLVSFLTLLDLGLSLLGEKEKKELPRETFNIVWYFKSSDPNYFYVVPKSAPIIDNEKVYFGSDNGNFWALHQNDGSIAWQYKVGWHTKGKSIFSSPALHNNTVYFGSYDGNVYALNTASGKKKWIFMEADWVGSSPVIAPDLNLLFIGLEFGLFKKSGGIAALDLDTGEKKWDYIMTEYVHGSPVYSSSKGLVAVGGNDSTVYLFKAKNGEMLWSRKVDGEIKASLAFDEKRNLLLFGSFDGNMYALDIKSGESVIKYQMQAGMYSTPLVHDDKVIFSSLDKKIYCLNLDTKKLVWMFDAGARVFSTPVIIESNLFIGANDGRLYEIHPETGELIRFFQATERITNKPAYNGQTKRFFVLTYANEIYCIKRKDG